MIKLQNTNNDILRKYIGQVVDSELTKEIIEDKKHLINLFVANTGAGKSNWMINTFIPVAIDLGEKMTVLVNRSALKIQTQEEINEVKKAFGKPEASTYHKITKEELDNTSLLICDEAHFFMADGTFNENTEHNLKMILDYYNDGGKVLFITATEWELERYLQYIGYTNKINKFNYSEITSWSKRINVTITSKSYEKLIPTFGYYKSICFENISKERIENKVNRLISQGLDAGYCRSIWIKGTKKKDEIEYKKMEFIRNNYTTEHQHIFMTSAYDNGIHIKDENLKYIVIRNIYDVVSIIQMIGRKRFNAENEQDILEVYISVNKEQAERQYKKIKEQLQIEKDFRIMEKEKFDEKYKQYIFDCGRENKKCVVTMQQGNYCINETMIVKLIFSHDYLINFLQSNFKKSIANFIAPYLQKGAQEINIDNTDRLEYARKVNKIELNKAIELLPLLKSIENEQLYEKKLEDIRKMFVDKFGIKVRKEGQLPTTKKINNVIAVYGYEIRTVKKMINGNRYTVWAFTKMS